MKRSQPYVEYTQPMYNGSPCSNFIPEAQPIPDTSMIEVSNIREWSERNRMQLNMEKTHEMDMSKISTP